MDYRSFKITIGLLSLLVLALSCLSFAQGYDLELLSYSIVSGNYSSMIDYQNYLITSTGFGIKILDISSPSDPAEVAHTPTNGLSKSVNVDGNYLLVSDIGTGLLVYNIEDINNPVLLDQIEITGTIRSACPYGDYIYVAAEDYGIQIVDWNDPYNLELMETIYCGGEALMGITNDQWLYMTVGIAGMVVYNIAEPLEPELTLTWNTTGGKAGDLYMFPNADYLAIADFGNGVHILDLTYPSIPTWSDSISYPPYLALSVDGYDDYGVAAYNDQGIQTFNVNGEELDFLEMGDKCGIVHAIEDYIYVSMGDSVIAIVNSMDPSDIFTEGSLYNLGATSQIEVVGDIAYIANMVSGLTVLDISDRTSPYIIESTPTGFWAKDVIITPENYLYIADFHTGVNVFNLNDPLHPALVNTVSTDPDTGAHAFAYQDGYLYLAVYDFGLNVFDLTNPETPDLIFISEDSTAYYRELAFSADGQHLYACAEESGLLGYTINAPNDIVHDYTLDFLPRPFDIEVSGNYAYVANKDDGLFILDVTNHYYVFSLDSLPTQGSVSGVTLMDDNTVAISDWTAGVAVIDVTDPENVEEIERKDTPGYAWNLVTDGSYLYVADTYDLAIFDLIPLGVGGDNQGEALPEDLVIFNPAYPNPFNASSTLSFELYNPQNVNLSIYNINGEKVISLLNSDFDAGQHQIAFNAENLASGIYIAILKAGTVSHTQKLLLIK
ncbi:hypothetical protein CEE37_05655 [candidate division LCP-89 bacterium B3_LCP]|uniref:Secretion system C-terminal sorting domain-containing protein n=1 Tax=candidate division LCP-89 bacterium B3_LCP TaxID=2012998 RepID=A0A532V1U6_UNCL8|nr:MAG: hypothetical protein CEE37_05655 [candidate division LCP-89 bacterium B3_LCP]